ncbi:MAG TPA: alkaline phosphatase family protein [Gemmatimonadales bacterium]|nr:alkaline phosphatase family protein [Gemmatimonadales bacterium]
MTRLLRAQALVGAMILGAACIGADANPAVDQTAPPPIDHVFIIVLENRNYDATFGPGSAGPYLADTLVKQGALLTQYYGIGHASLDNYIAMIAGIAPNPSTQGDCPVFTNFVETGMSPDGQPIGLGCVYPTHVLTIGNQLAGAGKTWRAYLEDMGNNPSREAATCAHPAIGAVDPTERADNTNHDRYATKHNPFMYFHAVIDSASCAQHVVPLTNFDADLKGNTPSFSFIVPNLCHDGHDPSCVDQPGGLAGIDEFLAHWVPAITHSAAFKHGLLVITFDESGNDDTSCCDEPSGPNTRVPGGGGPGGGRTGAVLLSPYIAPGTISAAPYNHYSLLRTIEDIFRLQPYLGYAGRPGLAPLGADVFTRR